MKIDNTFKTIFASMMIVSGLVACDKPGTAESAGKKIDQVTENVSSSVSNTADKASESMSNQGKVASKAMNDTEITAKTSAASSSASGCQTPAASPNCAASYWEKLLEPCCTPLGLAGQLALRPDGFAAGLCGLALVRAATQLLRARIWCANSHVGCFATGRTPVRRAD